jgi:dolichol-phosphate mannosyltransferase
MPTAAMISSSTQVDDAAPFYVSPAAAHESAVRKIALVIPTLRESENIVPLLRRVRAAMAPLKIPYEILVVDDDSGDRTREIVAAMARKDARVRLLVRKGQRGLSGAILHGWAHTDAPILGVMDADLQHPPELLPELIRSIFAGRDLAIGSRYAVGGAIASWNPLRRLLSAAAVWVTFPIQRTQLRASDPMSGFFFVRRDCLEGISFLPCGFKLLLEILVRGRIRSVGEIPFAFGIRYRGASKVNVRVAFDYARLLVRLYASRLGGLVSAGSGERAPSPLSLFCKNEPRQDAVGLQEDH